MAPNTVFGASFGRRVIQSSDPPYTGTMSEGPARYGPQPAIACSLDALDTASRKRQHELLAVVRSRVQSMEELPDGFAATLPADPALFLQVAEWVSLERRCCPFADFTIEWTRDDVVRVRFTGGDGAKEVFAAEILGEEGAPSP